MSDRKKDDRHLLESMALQALSLWPHLAPEEIAADWWTKSDLGSMAGAVLTSEHRMPDGSVPLVDCAIRACIPDPEDWVLATYTAAFATAEHGKEWVGRLADRVAMEGLRAATLEALERGGVGEAREALFAALRASGGSEAGIQDMGAASRSLAQVRAEALSRGETIGVPTGLAGLDRLLKGGWRPSSWVLLAGTSEVGKSTLEAWFRRSLAKRGIHSLLFSGEMPVNDLAEREIHAALGIGLERDLGFQEYSEVKVPAFTRFMRVDPRQPLTLEKMSNAIRMEKERNGSLGLVVVDSFGKVKPPRGEKGSILDEVARYTWTAEQMKALAMSANVPVLVIHHLSKGKPPTDEPKAADIRGSQKVFDEADAVLGVWRGQRGGQVFLKSLKGRHRSTHEAIELRYHTTNQGYVEVPKL